MQSMLQLCAPAAAHQLALPATLLARHCLRPSVQTFFKDCPLHTCTHAHACAHARAHARMHIRMHARMHAHMQSYGFCRRTLRVGSGQWQGCGGRYREECRVSSYENFILLFVTGTCGPVVILRIYIHVYTPPNFNNFSQRADGKRREALSV